MVHRANCGVFFAENFEKTSSERPMTPHDPGSTFWADYFEISYVEIWIWNVSEKWPPNMPKTAKIGRFPTSNGAVDNTTAQLIIISRYRVTDDPWPCNCIKDFFYRMIYILENAISKTHFFGFSGFFGNIFLDILNYYFIPFMFL